MRTADTQRSIVARDPVVTRSHTYFREQMPKASDADALVADYRLLKVALESVGLESDINNRFFIRKVLESDPDDPKSLANRLSDKRYVQLSRSFGFGTAAAQPLGPDQIEGILERHVSAEFETRVGRADADMRLGLYAQRELSAILNTTFSEKTKWYRLLGSPPLRKVVEGAFGFGSAYAKLPIDRQVKEFQDAAARTFGTSDPAHMGKPENIEKLIQRFLLRAQTQTNVRSGYAIALALLSS